MDTVTERDTPCKLSADKVQAEFKAASFRFIRPSEGCGPEGMGCDVANEIDATLRSIASFARQAFSKKMTEKIIKFSEKKMLIERSSQRLAALQGLLDRVADKQRLDSLKGIMSKLSEAGITGTKLSFNNKKLREEYLRKAVQEGALELFEQYKIACYELELKIKALRVDKVPVFFPVSNRPSQDPEMLRSQVGTTCLALNRVRRNIAWIDNPASFVYDTDAVKQKFKERIKNGSDYPDSSEQSEYRLFIAANPESATSSFISLAIFNILNKLEPSQREAFWLKIKILDLSQQQLWHIYKDLAQNNEAQFIEKIDSFSQDVMAVSDDNLWFLRRDSNLIFKQTIPLERDILHFYKWKAMKLLLSLEVAYDKAY